MTTLSHNKNTLHRIVMHKGAILGNMEMSNGHVSGIGCICQ